MIILRVKSNSKWFAARVTNTLVIQRLASHVICVLVVCVWFSFGVYSTGQLNQARVLCSGRCVCHRTLFIKLIISSFYASVLLLSLSLSLSLSCCVSLSLTHTHTHTHAGTHTHTEAAHKRGALCDSDMIWPPHGGRGGGTKHETEWGSAAAWPLGGSCRGF